MFILPKERLRTVMAGREENKQYIFAVVFLFISSKPGKSEERLEESGV